jgi:hypothetical protein
MRRGAFIFFLFFQFYTPKLRGQNSPLSSGQWVKIAVGKQGIFQLSGAQLKSMGFPIPFPSNQLQLFGFDLSSLQEKVTASFSMGLNEQALDVQDRGDGQMDEKDNVFFYASGPIQWKQNGLDGFANHEKKTVKDSVYYFLTQGKNGKRIATQVAQNKWTKTLDKYDENWLIENDTISLLNSGQLWLGPPMGQGIGKQPRFNFLFNTEGVDITSPLQFKTQLAAASYQSAAVFSLQLNGQILHNTSIQPISGLVYDDAAILDQSNFDFSPSVSNSIPVSSNLQVDFTSPTTSGTGWIDYIEMHAKRSIGFWGTKAFGFRNFSVANTLQSIMYQVQKADTTCIVWDVSRPSTPVKMQLSVQNGVASFVQLSDTINDFFTVQQNAFETPTIIGKINNQNIVATPLMDYVMVVPAAYKNAAIRLQQFHQNTHHLKVELVIAEELYNEFSGGQPSAIAIRNFLKYISNKALAQKATGPKYVLLFGMGNFNNKKINTSTQIPSYESVASTGILSSYTSDDFYGLLTDGYDINVPSSINSLSMAIGRIPVRTIAEADTVVNKLIQYQQNINAGAWKNQLTWIADDGDYNLHLQDAEEITNNLKSKAPFWNQQKMYLDLYPAVSTTSGNTYPSLVSDLKQMLHNGSLLLNYSGHGNYIRLAEEAVISATEIAQWDNAGKPPLLVTASCDFAPYDQPQLSPIGFDALLQNSKGVIGLVSASRLVFAYSNKQINDAYIQQLLVPNNSGQFNTIGEALMFAKNNNWAQNGDRVNAFKFMLIGDPAMYLAKPAGGVSITSIRNKIFNGGDTLTAGTGYQLNATVQTNGVANKKFNGVVELVIYDAATMQKTLGNQATSIPVFVSTQQQILFRGKATVMDGNATINFILPKETSVQKGPLKIQLYAYNDSTDAMGVFNTIYVNNIAKTATIDSIGPTIHAWINDTHFTNGTWVTNPATLLLALSDSAGIQTSGNALGHDLVVILDGDLAHPIVLNHFYTADINTYQSGTVQYLLPNLEVGKHSLTIKAWDLFGNSNTDTISFEVPPLEQLHIRNLSISPNPVDQQAQIAFEHNVPAGMLNVRVEIIDFLGNIIRSNSMPYYVSSNKILLDMNAMHLSVGQLVSGLYFVKLTISNTASSVFLTSKMIKK